VSIRDGSIVTRIVDVKKLTAVKANDAFQKQIIDPRSNPACVRQP